LKVFLTPNLAGDVQLGLKLHARSDGNSVEYNFKHFSFKVSKDQQPKVTNIDGNVSNVSYTVDLGSPSPASASEYSSTHNPIPNRPAYQPPARPPVENEQNTGSKVFCPNCKNEITAMKFCENCGYRLDQ